jgi:exosortase K
MRTKTEKGKRFMLQNGIFLLPALLFAVGLKYHYSVAGSEDLAWILRPTAGLVELLSGIRFEEEAHTGFLSRAHRVVIAPACAGVNFFIVAFCMVVFSGVPRIEPSKLKCMWLAASVIAVYLLTIFVNALRIILSIYSYDVDLYSGWTTPERVHRLEGVLIYFFFLRLFYSIIGKGLRPLSPGTAARADIFRSGRARSGYSRWVLAGSSPLFWYLLVTVAVPLLNGAASDNSVRFAEHGGMVIAGCLIVWAVLLLTRSGWWRIGDRIRRLNH